MKLIKAAVIFFMFVSISFAADVQPKMIFKATIDKYGVQRVEVTGGEYFFKPDYIIVKVNVPVELIVRKEPGIVPHNIVIKAPEAGIDFAEDMGKEQKVIKFTPTKTGRYPIYCDKRFLFFKSHRDRGMEGILEVVE